MPAQDPFSEEAKADFLEAPTPPGQENKNFSAAAQRDKFLGGGGLSENDAVTFAESAALQGWRDLEPGTIRHEVLSDQVEQDRLTHELVLARNKLQRTENPTQEDRDALTKRDEELSEELAKQLKTTIGKENTNVGYKNTAIRLTEDRAIITKVFEKKHMIGAAPAEAMKDHFAKQLRDSKEKAGLAPKPAKQEGGDASSSQQPK